MDYIIQTITSLFRKGQSNLIKIVCLAVGLSLGLILIAKVCFENSRDSFIPHKERVYTLTESFKRHDEKEFSSHNFVPGGVAPGFATAIPQIEVASRLTWLNGGGDNKLVINNRQQLSALVIAADSNIFEFIATPIIIGDPSKILTIPYHAMVSRSLAEKMGGIDIAVGQNIHLQSSEFEMIVDGIFEDIPESYFEDIPESYTIKYNVIVSINTMGEWSITNWLGNDRYKSFLRLCDGADRAEVVKAMRAEQDRHIDPEWLEEQQMDAHYNLISLKEIEDADVQGRNLKMLLLFLGLSLIIISTLNYLLIVISTLANRVKEIAVYKCYGASWNFLIKMTFQESALHLSLAIILGIIIIASIKGIAETLLSASLSALFATNTLVVISIICIILLAVTTVIPAYIFTKIPVAAAFRNFKESKKRWKLGLLFVQFASTAIIIGLLTTVTWQYQYIENTDRGYKYDNLLIFSSVGISQDKQKTLVAELSKMPNIESVSRCNTTPYDLSGNMVRLPGDRHELFNIADFYSVTRDYFETMGITIADGTVFDPDKDNSRTVMVSESFVDRMREMGIWDDTAIGKEICVSEHSKDENDAYTIVGVYKNILCGSGNNFDFRPSVTFYDTDDKQRWTHPNYIIIKLNNIDSESINSINTFLSENIEERETVAEPYKGLILQQLVNERHIRDALLICTIVALIIALLGLYGYTMDEINRRKREIAIRKVLGTSSAGIMRIISQDITYIAIPALLIGSAIAYYVSVDLLQNYSLRVDPSIFLYLGLAACVYILIMTCVAIQLYRAANENPVNNLKTE